MRLNNLCIEVEVLAGGHVRDAITDMRSLADRLGIMVKSDLNGVKTIVWPGDNVGDVYQSWEYGLSRSSGLKIATARGPFRPAPSVSDENPKGEDPEGLSAKGIPARSSEGGAAPALSSLSGGGE